MCWAILQANLTLILPIFTKEETNVDMAGVAGARTLSVLLHLYCTHIVLKNDVIFKFVTLFFHEILKIQCVRQIVAETNYLGFCGALYVYLCLDAWIVT